MKIGMKVVFASLAGLLAGMFLGGECLAATLNPPSTVVASTSYIDHVNVSWSYADFTYSIWRGETEATNAAIQIGLANSSFYNDSNVCYGIRYYYWVKIMDTSGVWSAFSVPATGSVRRALAPSSVSATGGAYTDRIDVTWYSSGDGTNFSVWHSTSNDSNTAVMLGIGTNSSYSYSYADHAAIPYVSNYYWVKTISVLSTSDFSSVACGWMDAPDAPISVSASDGKYASKVVVTWQLSASGGAGNSDVCSIWRSTNASTAMAESIGTVAVASGGAGNSAGYTFSDTHMARGVHYYYWVRVTVNGAMSGFSLPDEGYALSLAPLVWNDFDGDGQSDLGVYDSGYWSLYSLAHGILINHVGPFGGAGSIPVSGDYDGDRKSDAAIYDSGYWSIYSLANGPLINHGGPWGGVDSLPVPGDYDGDGKSDLAVYRNGYWSIYSLANGIITNNVGPWGGANSIPVPGDYDGDSQSDLAVYDSGYWSLYSLENGIIINHVGPWGGAGSFPVPGDFDGDNKSDLAVYDNGYWSIYSLAHGLLFTHAGPWGGADSLPVSGNYDGDNQSDLNVYRAGYWSLYSLAHGILINNAGPWGGLGSIPLGAVYTSGPPVNITGTWQGTYKLGNVGTVSVVAYLTQNGKNVSGTASWGGSSASDVSGTVNGHAVSLVFDYRAAGWDSDVVAGTVDGDDMYLTGSDGTYSVIYDLYRTSMTAVNSLDGAMEMPEDGSSQAGLAKPESCIQQQGQ